LSRKLDFFEYFYLVRNARIYITFVNSKLQNKIQNKDWS